MTSEEAIENLKLEEISIIGKDGFPNYNLINAHIISIEALQENSKLKAEIEQLKAELEQSAILPCKVGDIVYKANKASGAVRKHKIIKIDYELNGGETICQIWFENYDFCFARNFGKTIFLTQEEAERHLKGKVEE